VASRVTIDVTPLKRALKQIGADTPKAIEAELEQMANRAAAAARSAVPVDEGTLRDSIRVEKDSPSRVVVLAGGADAAPYAGHIEYGTSRMGAQPFMRPAAVQAERELAQRMADAFRSAVEKVSEK